MSGKFVKENKSMAPVLGMNTASWEQGVASNFRTHFREFSIDKFVQSELTTVQFSQRHMLLFFLLCFLLFSFILVDFSFDLNSNS